ncbi:MAG: dihydropteroate synthase [Chlamydiales bacterium]|jgi:dihydropteroate synthase|nr:dihydropteroate synthase [Chlamydiales bacterium]
MDFFNPCLFHPSSERKTIALMQEIGADQQGIEIMALKAQVLLVRMENISLQQAQIIKQEMLARGGDASVHRDVAALEKPISNILISGSENQIRQMARKLRGQPFGLREVGMCLLSFLRERKPPPIYKKELSPFLGDQTRVMGIVNCTPDSFSDGDLYDTLDKQVAKACLLAEQGADILDIGGESTRPKADAVSAQEEKERVIPLIQALKGKVSCSISIDTYKASVAEAAVAAGAHIINDISGGLFDPEILTVAAKAKSMIILSHCGLKHGQSHINSCPTSQVVKELRQRIEAALSAGVAPEKIILDPGLGFGKRPEENLALLNQLEAIIALGYPVLVGASRKSFIGSVLDLPFKERLEGSIASAVIAAYQGAHIVRVHDVLETARACRMACAIKNS